MLTLLPFIKKVCNNIYENSTEDLSNNKAFNKHNIDLICDELSKMPKLNNDEILNNTLEKNGLV